MMATNGTAAAPGTELDVIEAREQTPLDAYLESSRQTRSRIVDELRELRENEARIIRELTAQLGEAKARRDSYERAAAALAGQTRPAPKAPKSTGGGRKYNWHISDGKVAEIEARIRELAPTIDDGRFTAALIGRETPGMSPETVRRAIAVLREREVVRAAGAARGGGTYFALMPDGD
jgi:CRP-like cAMP-binding protein